MSLLIFCKWKTCYKSGKLHMVSRMRKHPQPQATKDSLDGRIISFMCFSFNFSRFPPSQDCIKPKHIFSHSCKLLILKFSIFFGRLIWQPTQCAHYGPLRNCLWASSSENSDTKNNSKGKNDPPDFHIPPIHSQLMLVTDRQSGR